MWVTRESTRLKLKFQPPGGDNSQLRNVSRKILPTDGAMETYTFQPYLWIKNVFKKD